MKIMIWLSGKQESTGNISDLRSSGGGWVLFIAETEPNKIQVNIATFALLAIKTLANAASKFWSFVSSAHCCYFSRFPYIFAYVFSFLSESFKNGTQNFGWPLFLCLKECSWWKTNGWVFFLRLILTVTHFMQTFCQNIHGTIQFVIKTCILLQACDFEKKITEKPVISDRCLERMENWIEFVGVVYSFGDSVCIAMIWLRNWARHFVLFCITRSWPVGIWFYFCTGCTVV